MFGLAFRTPGQGIAVGGDFEAPADGTDAMARTRDGRDWPGAGDLAHLGEDALVARAGSSSSERPAPSGAAACPPTAARLGGFSPGRSTPWTAPTGVLGRRWRGRTGRLRVRR